MSINVKIGGESSPQPRDTSIGVNINTSPVLDLRIKGSSNIIGDRSFSRNPKIVS